MELSAEQEKELLNRFNTGDDPERVFTELLGHFQKRVYWHIRRIVINHEDADDVLQNTFIRIWEKLGSFRGESRLYTWIFRIATNEALSFLQKKQNRMSISMDELQEQLGDSLKASTYFNGNRTELVLQQAILSLPEKQRLVFNMKYYEGLKYEEMEEILGTSVGALKASYHLASKKIEEFVKRTLNS